MELVVLRGDPEQLTDPALRQPLDPDALAAALRAEPGIEAVGGAEYRWPRPGAEVDIWVTEHRGAPYAVFISAGVFADEDEEHDAVLALARRLAQRTAARVWSPGDDRFED